MRMRHLHDWDVTPARAREIQESLRHRLKFPPLSRKPRIVAGADISYNRGSDRLYAGVVLFRLPELTVLESHVVVDRARFPYIPGYLSFREIPPLLKAFERLRNRPQALICDGQGRAHPRQFGLACHLGLLLDLPTVGCAKTRLVGEYREPAGRRWSHSELIYQDECLGWVVRTREGVKPVFLSAGCGVDLPGSLEILRSCTTRYRLPEPIRSAHRLVNEARTNQQPIGFDLSEGESS